MIYENESERVKEKFDELSGNFTEEKVKNFQESQLGKACCRAIMAYLMMGEVDDFDEEYPEGIDPMIIVNEIVDASDYYRTDYNNLFN